MLEHSIYAILSPEGFASILYKDSSKAEQAAKDMKLTAQDLLQFKIIDGIIPEPQGGAHNDYDITAGNIKSVIEADLQELLELPVEELLEKRYQKFRRI
jgi:acetyl-CoA carboxylase carboxyl transferase subunit alpha